MGWGGFGVGWGEGEAGGGWTFFFFFAKQSSLWDEIKSRGGVESLIAISAGDGKVSTQAAYSRQTALLTKAPMYAAFIQRMKRGTMVEGSRIPKEREKKSFTRVMCEHLRDRFVNMRHLRPAHPPPPKKSKTHQKNPILLRRRSYFSHAGSIQHESHL